MSQAHSRGIGAAHTATTDPHDHITRVTDAVKQMDLAELRRERVEGYDIKAHKRSWIAHEIHARSTGGGDGSAANVQAGMRYAGSGGRDVVGRGVTPITRTTREVVDHLQH